MQSDEGSLNGLLSELRERLEYRKRMWFIIVPAGYNSVRIIGYRGHLASILGGLLAQSTSHA